MITPLTIVLALTLLALVLFITDALPVELVALLVLSVLFLSGTLTVEEGLAGFSNEATIAIGSMFILSEGLRQTGALRGITNRLQKIFEQGFQKGLLVMMVGAALMSAFINNVAVVAVMLPVLLEMSRKLDISPSRLLIPLSFAAMFGGSMTLIGTSSTLLVSGLITAEGLEPIGMFEVTPLGIALFVVGIIYLMTLGQRLLPDRPVPQQWTKQFDRPNYRARVELRPDHEKIGQPATEFFDPDDDAEVVAIFRKSERVTQALSQVVLEPLDILRIAASPAVVSRLERHADADVLPLRQHRDEQPSDDDEMEALELFQVVIAPRSSLVGKTLNSAEEQIPSAGTVVALRRTGEVVVDDLLDVELQGGDVLLLEAPQWLLQDLEENVDFLVVSEVPAEHYKSQLLIPVLLIFGAIVTLAALEFFPIVQLAVAGCVAMILLRVLSVQDAYRAVDWQVIFLLGGFIPLGTALEKVGAIDIIAQGLVSWLGGYGPLALLAGFYLVTNFMSDLISNQATAVLITPVAIATAMSMGIDPRPFVIAIAFASSDSFASPVGYHTNVMIYGAGNYRYLDFVKVGLPLNLLFLATAVAVLPLFWSF